VGRADQGHLALALLESHGLGAHHHRGGLLDLGDAAHESAGVLESEVVRGPAQARHAPGRLRLPRDDDHQVGADARELADHVASRSLAEGGQGHDRGDPDRDAEQAQTGPQPMPAQRPHGEADHVDETHAPFSAAESTSTAS
jgi:hypothetical protein